MPVWAETGRLGLASGADSVFAGGMNLEAYVPAEMVPWALGAFFADPGDAVAVERRDEGMGRLDADGHVGWGT